MSRALHKGKKIGKTYIKTIIREIRGSLGRFAAIFGIVALGSGFLSGLLATTPDMKLSVDRYFDETAMMDVFIKGTMGLTEEDARALAGLGAVETVMPAFSIDALVTAADDKTFAARVFGLPLSRLSLNKLKIIEGRSPESPDECLVQQGGGYFTDIPVGTKLKISTETLRYNAFQTLDEVFAVQEFTVTGVAQSPLFLSYEREPSTAGSGTLDLAVYAYQDAFRLPAYTDFFVTLKGASQLAAFYDPYQLLVDKGVKEITEFGAERSVLRRREIIADAEKIKEKAVGAAQAEYEKGKELAEKELADGEKKLADAEKELADGEKKLADAETRIADGKKQIADGRAAFEREKADAETRFSTAEDALKKGEKEIAAAKKKLAESKSQLDAVKEEVEKVRSSAFLMRNKKAKEGVAEYDAGLAAYNAGVKTVAENEAALRKGRADLIEGRKKAQKEFADADAELALRTAEIADGAAEIAANRQKLAEGRAELAKGRARFAEEKRKAEKELREGAEKIENARAEPLDADIPQPEWYVFDRNSNAGAAAYKVNVEKINDVAKVFPVFFLLIAGLIALTTMTRMVAEERAQIGVLKALGYGKRIILLKYLVYCGLTGVAGSAVGMLAGFRVFPLVIYNAFGTMGRFPPLITRFDWGFGLLACVLVLACVFGATIFACYHSLWEKPAFLMTPRAPKAGKRIFLEYLPFIWKRMKFTHKVTARNLIRQKRHFFMTITGISGCTALMVAGFGLRDSIADIARTEFAEILRYDTRIELRNDDFSMEDGGKIEKWGAVHIESGSIMNNDGEKTGMSLIIPQFAASFPDFINLRERKTKKSIDFSGDSVVLTEKIAEKLHLKKGGAFFIENADGKRAKFKVSGVTENYAGAFCYIGRFAYEKAFQSALSFNTVFALTGIRGKPAQDAFTAQTLADANVLTVSFTSQLQSSYNNLLNSINFIVIILIFASGCLAMLVIYNLTNININERKREIAALRVLGFHQGEAAAYIFREITVLSVIGAFAGLFLGVPLHRFIIGVAENADLMFGRNISLWGFTFSAVITLVFSAFVDLLMLPKLRAIKMAESMKASE
jgi:putative ABC transport system permease protein